MGHISKKLGVFIFAVSMFTAGAGALAIRVSEDIVKVLTYNSYIESARAKAEKGIVYYAKKDYLNAFSEYPDDQNMFREFLSFLEQTGDESYRIYLQDYRKKYPDDASGYEKLCELYMTEGNYKQVQEILLEAKDAGVSTERLADLWDQVCYRFIDLAGGYEDASVFYGKQSIVQRNGKKGMYYLGSGLILETKYEAMTYSLNNVVAVDDGEECYFVDNAGNKCGVLNKSLDSLGALSNGYCSVSLNGHYGYANSSLEVPERLPYDYATTFSDGVAAVQIGGKWGLVNTEGEYIVEPVYDDVMLTEFNTAVSAGVIFVKESGYWKMLNTQGAELSGLRFDEVCTFLLGGQPAAVKLNGRWTFIQSDGQLYDIPTEVFAAKSFNNGLAPVTLDGKLWGYMDTAGRIVIEPQFEDCRQFSEYGAAPVKEGQNWSFIQLLMYRN